MYYIGYPQLRVSYSPKDTDHDRNLTLFRKFFPPTLFYLIPKPNWLHLNLLKQKIPPIRSHILVIVLLSTILSGLGLKNAIDFDGLIRNIIGETGIHDTSEDYEPETTKYCDSAPGLGAVLRAVAAIVKFNHSLLV